MKLIKGRIKFRIVTEGGYTSVQYSELTRRFWGGEEYWGPWKYDDYYNALHGSTACLAESAIARYMKWADEGEEPFEVKKEFP